MATGEVAHKDFYWPERGDLQKQIVERFASDDLHRAWAELLVEHIDRVLQLRQRAAHTTESAHWLQRGSAGISAAVSAVTGGALIGQLSGSLAAVIGVIAAALGIVAGAVAAARPGETYTADLTRKAQYEQLFWRMRAFALSGLAAIDASGFETQVAEYAAIEAMITSGGGGTTPAALS
jgi:hypothetical protein